MEPIQQIFAEPLVNNPTTTGGGKNMLLLVMENSRELNWNLQFAGRDDDNQM